MIHLRRRLPLSPNGTTHPASVVPQTASMSPSSHIVRVAVIISAPQQQILCISSLSSFLKLHMLYCQRHGISFASPSFIVLLASALPGTECSLALLSNRKQGEVWKLVCPDALLVGWYQDGHRGRKEIHALKSATRTRPSVLSSYLSSTNDILFFIFSWDPLTSIRSKTRAVASGLGQRIAVQKDYWYHLGLPSAIRAIPVLQVQVFLRYRRGRHKIRSEHINMTFLTRFDTRSVEGTGTEKAVIWFQHGSKD